MNEQHMPSTMVAQGTEYELLVSDDGAAYILRFKPDQLAARLEGEDAMRFRTDYDTITRQYPNWAPDQTLAQLWDQGGYSWLASQEEG